MPCGRRRSIRGMFELRFCVLYRGSARTGSAAILNLYTSGRYERRSGVSAAQWNGLLTTEMIVDPGK